MSSPPKIRLKLLPEEHYKEFANADELLTFLNQEIAAWQNAQIPSLNNRFAQFRQEVQNEINRYRSQAPEILQREIQQTITSQQNPNTGDLLIFSTTAAGIYLLEIARKLPREAAQGAYWVFCGGRHGGNVNDPQFLLGAVAAANFKGASLDARADAELAAAKSSREHVGQIQTEVEALLEHSRSGLRNISVAQSATENALESLESNSKDKLDSAIATLNETNDKAFKNWENGAIDQAQEAQQRIKALEKLYEQKLQLEKPARHWQNLQRVYEKRGRGWLCAAVAISFAFVFLLLRILYIPPEALESHAFAGAMGIRALVLLGVIISILIYLIRFLFKLSTSAFHLSRDARERAQLTYFYLALLRADKSSINTDERKIILQALFARADTGLLSSDGPTMPGMPGSLGAIIGGLQAPHGK